MTGGTRAAIVLLLSLRGRKRLSTDPAGPHELLSVTARGGHFEATLKRQRPIQWLSVTPWERHGREYMWHKRG